MAKAPVKICIYGAGAIGGYLGVILANSGAQVTLIARGAHLAAIRGKGLKLITDEGERIAKLACTDKPAEAGPQDFVILTLKAHSVPAIADAVQPLLGPDTAVVTAQNGIPWWYFYQHGGPLDGKQIDSVDPGAVLWRKIPPERCIGCVVYPATEIVEPGVIRHTYGNRFMLGEPDGSRSERCQKLSKIMTKGGLKAPVRPRIRDDIWLKLWGNVAFNPVSALTGATMVRIAREPETGALIRHIMAEAQAIAEALGVTFPVDVDARIEGAANVGEHKTSMLQDLELGRHMEIDALVTVVAEIGDRLGIDTPYIDTVLALVKERARLAGCY